MLSHHAYLCQLDKLPLSCVDILPSQLDRGEMEELQFTSFGIADVRRLIERSYLAPAKGNYKVIRVVFNSITSEAQQALLKLTEEPPQSTKLVFVTLSSVTFLPTLLSRFSLFTVEESSVENSVWSEWLSLSLRQKMDLLNRRIESKDQDWTLSIKSGLSQWLSNEVCKLSVAEAEGLYFVLKNLGQRGAANKMLLEDLALMLEGMKEKL